MCRATFTLSLNKQTRTFHTDICFFEITCHWFANFVMLDLKARNNRVTPELILSYLRVVSQGLCKMKLSPVFALRRNLDYVVVGLQLVLSRCRKNSAILIATKIQSAVANHTSHLSRNAINIRRQLYESSCGQTDKHTKANIQGTVVRKERPWLNG